MDFFSQSKTFRPKKQFSKGSKLDNLHSKARLNLSTGDLNAAVHLPEHEDLNEWFAVNTVDFFNQINLLYGNVSDVCTATTCPIMSAGENYEYLWADEHTKPIKVSAPDYITRLMEWIQKIIDDEKVFPSSTEQSFPANFQQTVKNIFRRLFRVYAHIYCHHLTQIASSTTDGLEAQLHTSFKHFYLFVKEFALIEKKELLPLADLIEHLCGDKLQ